EVTWASITARACSLELPRRRTVVVVPHPDDETLLAGGLIARQTGLGVPVVIVAVTDGEAAYPSWPAPGLARVRRGEQDKALHMLDVPHGSTIRLEIPDGKVADHEQELGRLLADIIDPGDIVVAPWVHDWHPDHEACGRAARRATTSRPVTLIGSLFWAYHRVDPIAYPQLDVRRLGLTEHELNRRLNALDAHRSQLQSHLHEPILSPSLFEHLATEAEHFVVAS
ncbi:MAG TPA: PIG-L family deacetylase, partial [Ilumatobacteraceae bacterium]|nr:PIG-L family deacetylase [Ilumatobacteraceae bacterium]